MVDIPGSDISLSHAVLIGIPLLFYLCGGMGRLMLRRSDHFWDRQDWYLAPDAALSNIAAALLFLAESHLPPAASQALFARPDRQALAALFAALAMALYLAVIGAHQKLEHPSVRRLIQQAALVGFCNVAAIGYMVAFLTIVKEI